MSAWVKLTHADGTPTWINLDHVVQIEAAVSGSQLLGPMIAVTGDFLSPLIVHVQETPDQILDRAARMASGGLR